jgi:hypothetical protein
MGDLGGRGDLLSARLLVAQDLTVKTMGHFTGHSTTKWNRITGAEEIVKGIRYRVADAALVAQDGQYDIYAGQCNPSVGRACLLFRGIRGHYFELVLTDWKGERDQINPLSIGDAMERYRELPEKVLTWPEAFPEVPVQEA